MVTFYLKKGLSCVWNNIVRKEEAVKKDNIYLNRLMKGSVDNGKDVQFWTDTWALNLSLHYLFSALFSLEKYKGCLVKNRLRTPGPVDRIKWQWYRAPSSNIELMELNRIVAILDQISITNQEDKWTWQAEDLGNFTVKSVRKIISDINTDINTGPSDAIFDGIDGYREKLTSLAGE
ncbi:hypothetical protein HanIR_Chr09g0432001 [Helianthus annuus]|nr:hypothetical protein HanIR_Chr09g0432001 [Helianthus annuus]